MYQARIAVRPVQRMLANWSLPEDALEVDSDTGKDNYLAGPCSQQMRPRQLHRSSMTAQSHDVGVIIVSRGTLTKNLWDDWLRSIGHCAATQMAPEPIQP